MFEFDKLCKEIEEMDPQLFAEVFAAKSANVIAALSAITNDALDGMQLFLHFILCSIAADGKLAEEEYLLIKPAIERSTRSRSPTRTPFRSSRTPDSTGPGSTRRQSTTWSMSSV